LGSGAVAALSYGNKLPVSALGLLATAVSVVILPHFSELNAARSWRASRKLYVQSASFLLVAGALVSGACLGFSEPLVRLMFERGAFSSSNTREVAGLMQVYLLQVPFALMSVVSFRALTSMSDTKTMTVAAFAQVLGAAVLGYVLSLKSGVIGVAMGTSSATISVSVLMAVVTWWRFGLRIRT
jgi:putative peptidoglycan lipid II flippase